MSQNAKDTDSHIGRRLKLRDLQILASVAQHGSMAKAGAQLSTTQPTVSQAIAELEDAVGVWLFDRSTQGGVTCSDMARSRSCVVEARPGVAEAAVGNERDSGTDQPQLFMLFGDAPCSADEQPGDRA